MVPADSASASRRISHYVIEHRLGAGGMGEVFAGFDETLTRRVALKAIRPDQRLNADAKARFLREARILSGLDHPNICRVYDYIEGEDRDWLVLELIEGRNLRTALDAGLDRASKMKIAEQIAAVLAVTHAAGVVHRDLKPGNVMITRGTEVKVLDFGLARSRVIAAHGREESGPGDDHATALERVEVADAELTRTIVPGASGSSSASGSSVDFETEGGAIMGTLAYMSPEQARGEVASSAGDMYSFGLLLQEIFTGRPPYAQAPHYTILLEKVRNAETVPPAGVGADLASLLQRLTSFAPAQRPTAVEAAERLRWIREKPKRRLRNLAVAAVVAVLALGGVKYTIDLARERTVAVAAREDADRRREQAEDLIGFMLGDLRGKLQQVGRLDVLEEVGRQAMAYFEAVPPGSLSDEELFRRAQAIHQLGQIHQALGNMSTAIEAYRESQQLAALIAARDPANSEWVSGLATAHFHLGNALRLSADLDGAMREFVAYRDIARRLLDREPQNVRWLLELSYGHGNVAAVQEAQGDLTSARRELEFAQAIKEDLVRRDPDNRQGQQALATGHNRLGVVIDRLGEGDEALRHYAADLEIRQQLVARDPQDQSIKRSLQVAISTLGRAYEDRGDLGAATTQYRAWLDLAAAMAATDPRNADWRRDLAIAEFRLATAFRLAGRLADAQAGYDRAAAILRPIAAASPTHAARQRDLASVETGLGVTLLGRGAIQPALAQAAAAERLLAPLVAGGIDADAARIDAEARLLAAEAWARRGDQARARAARLEALELVAHAAERSADKRTRDVWARALLALDRVDEARPLVQQLFTQSYRHPALVEAWRARTARD